MLGVRRLKEGFTHHTHRSPSRRYREGTELHLVADFKITLYEYSLEADSSREKHSPSLIF